MEGFMRMNRRAFLPGVSLVVALLAFRTANNSAASAKEAQAAHPHVDIPKLEPRADDVLSLDGIIKAYFEVVSGPAGKPREWSRDATLYIPNVRFVIVKEGAKGKTAAQSMTHQEFADDSEAARGGKAFYEREIHRIVHRAGNMAHVLSTAAQSASANGPALGHSIDSLDLYWDGTRWWIASANIWEVNPGHALPSEFLP
jgi:hypothetical protein